MQVRFEREVLLPSFQHGVGDPLEGDIFVSRRHDLVLVEGNYLLLGALAVQGCCDGSRPSCLVWHVVMPRRPCRLAHETSKFP